MKKILYTSSNIRAEILKLFSDPARRRVAITAFVGDGAEAYLPKPKGIHLICWPQPGGTNPNALRTLIKRGIEVSFVDSLHMKVYWAKGRGAIVTSANLSTHALGSGNLKEFGVLLDDNAINIDRVISSLRVRPVSEIELKRLDRFHKLYLIKNRTRFPLASKSPSFNEWYTSPYRAEWRLGWWDAYEYHFSSAAIAKTRSEYDTAQPTWGMACGRREFKKGDWVLFFRLLKNGASQAVWMSVDFISTLTKAESKLSGYPCDAIQVWSPKVYPERPFLLDAGFRQAFSKAVRAYGPERIMEAKSSKPPKQLLDLILEYH